MVLLTIEVKQNNSSKVRLRYIIYIDSKDVAVELVKISVMLLIFFTNTTATFTIGICGGDLYMKLLLAEDEVEMSEALVDILTYHKYLVDAVYNGDEALEYARADEYDGIILDIMMPGKNGLDVLKILRSEGCKVPILMLTAKAEVEDRIAGLDMGADDYLPKPFAMGELLARIRAMLRRKEEFIPNVLECGNVSLNMSTYELICNDHRVVLPKLEYQMMELFMLNKNMYLSSDVILERVWGYETDAEVGTVWVYISYLRKRLQNMGANVELTAKRNIGYRLEVIS